MTAYQKKNGYGRCIYSNGSYYEGGWLNDQFHGNEILRWSNGDPFISYTNKETEASSELNTLE